MASLSFTSCACNRTPNSVHWSYNDLVAYGATNGIAVVRNSNNNIVIIFNNTK